jgi:hypothetical protein
MKTIIVLLLLNVGTAFCEGVPPASYELQNMDTNGASAVLVSFGQQRDIAVQTLKSFLKEKDKAARRPDVLEQALNLVGRLRAPELVDETVDLITFRRIAYTDRFSTPSDFPVVGILVQMGQPALQAVMKQAAQDSDSLRLLLYAGVVRGILGPELGASFVRMRTERDRHLEQFRGVYFSWYPDPPKTATP